MSEGSRTPAFPQSCLASSLSGNTRDPWMLSRGRRTCWARALQRSKVGGPDPSGPITRSPVPPSVTGAVR